MRQHTLAVLFALLCTAEVANAVEKREITLDVSDFQLSPEVVVDPTDGSLRLARSVLLADEMGATDHSRKEDLNVRVWARKTFSLRAFNTRSDVKSADLFIFGSARQVQWNGRTLENLERLHSTGWTRAKVSPSWLVTMKEFQEANSPPVGGRPKTAKLYLENEIVLSGPGSVLLEPGRRPRHSARSSDGGQTWSRDEFGEQDGPAGEYLIRLRLGAFPPGGWVLSPVFDLWAAQGGEAALPGRLHIVQAPDDTWREVPEGIMLYAQMRMGNSPTPSPDSWTKWEPLHKFGNADQATARHRWAQLRFDFFNYSKVQATAKLHRKLTLIYYWEPDRLPNQDRLRVVSPGKAPTVALGSVPFTYQEPSPRLKLLRERYQLDKVIAPAKTEMEQLTLLRHWVRNQWHTAWGGNAAAWMPPWDAHIILACKDQPDCLTMCTHYAAVFTQCCLALGWNARHCILDHHCVSEVWVEQHRKWVMMDAGNSKERADVTLHFERNGVPLSALELHLAYHKKDTAGIGVCFTPAGLAEKVAALCRPAPPPKEKVAPRPDRVPIAELPKYPVCQLDNYRRYAFPARNNYLTSLLPGELYQGWSEYFYDGYWWVGDSPDDPKLSPEYSKHLDPARPQDIDWSLNWTRIHLARNDNAGELQVDLETHTPNLARFERRAEAGWERIPAAFVWKLKPGKNTLTVRSVNHWDRAGSESSVQVEWTPAEKR